MKKILFGLFAVFSVGTIQASSTISLPGGGDVAAAGGTANVVMTPLIPEVAYEVTCKIHNPNADKVDMHFEISQKTASSYNFFELNGNGLYNAVGSLNSGDNTMKIAIQTSAAQVSTIVFKNLDDKNVVTVSDCSGTPRAATVNLNGTHSGYFYATNNTGYGVTIRVGNVFPTTYNLYPGNFQSIWVSTNNQNIEISDIW